MKRINKLIEINANGRLKVIASCFKTIKYVVYNGDAKKAYASLEAKNEPKS